MKTILQLLIYGGVSAWAIYGLIKLCRREEPPLKLKVNPCNGQPMKRRKI